jgi:endonuclease/exonuclease/phosphatase family metal-dependent hydrolase
METCPIYQKGKFKKDYIEPKPGPKPTVPPRTPPIEPPEEIFETDLKLLTQNVMFLPEELEDLGVVKYVSERRPAAVELLKDYDIIGLQEVFDDDSQDHVVRGWYNDILGTSPEWIDIEEPILDQSEELGDMTDRGVIDARPNDEEAQMVCDKHFLMGPDQADLDQDGGLVIFSKYPIIKSSAFVFSESAIIFSDKMANKGVLYACIDITPEGSAKKFHIHVFNTHTQAGDEPVIRETQFEEFKKFIENCTEDDGYPIILLGDFNVEDGTDEYTRMNARFAAMKFVDVWRTLRPSEPGHTWTGEDQSTGPESPYGELGNVLAVDEGGPQRLDYYYHYTGEMKLTSEAKEIDTVPVSEEKEELYCFDNDESCNIIGKDGSCDGLKSYTASDHIGLRLELHVKELEEETED